MWFLASSTTIKEMKKNELSKEKRIKTELNRISVFFEKCANNQRAIVEPLIQNAAFMKVTLEDLQAAINEDGTTDHYQNGMNQHGVKISATLQSYNSLIKNYAAVIKSLSAILPREERTQAPAAFAWKPEEDPETPEELKARLEREHEEFCRQLEEDRKRWEQLTPEDMKANNRAYRERLTDKARTSEGG